MERRTRRLGLAMLLCSVSWVLGGGPLSSTDLATAACGDGAFDPGESCDDGGRVNGDGCSVDCRIEPRDYVLCYRIRPLGEEASRAPHHVSLGDPFESGSTTVGKPVMFCTAADTNHGGIIDSQAHLTCYRIRPLSERQGGRRRTVLIGNEFGGRVLTTKRARMLCVTSTPVSGLFPLVIPCGDSTLDAGEECDDGNTADGDGCSASCRLEPSQRYLCRRAKPTRQSPRFIGRNVSVADGLQASLMRTVKPARLCSPAELNGHGVRDSTVHLECFTIKLTTDIGKLPKQQIAVRNEFGTERFTVVTPRVLCAPSAEAAGLTIPERDSVKCYSVKYVRGTSRFEKRTVTLADRFETKETRILSPAEICNPADVDAAGLSDPRAHLSCYRIKQVSGQAKFRSRKVVVYNAFGTQTLTLREAKLECVPSEMPPVPSSAALDRLKCYSAEVTRGTPSFHTRRVRIADRFETKRSLVNRPALFCTPVDQDGAGMVDPARTLTCFSIRDAEAQPAFTKRTVSPGDEFGELTLTVSRAETICLPSIIAFET